MSSKTNGVTDIIYECSKDDVLTFAVNGTYTWDPASIKCDENDTSYTGTWYLSADEKTMIVDGDSITIIEISPSRITFSITYETDSYEYTYISF